MKQSVTNEQARAEVICGTTCECDECPLRGNCGGINGVDPNVYADLLDSRAIIEKQTEIIKEMRRELEDARTVMEKYEAQFTGELFNDPSLNALLERTKDYS